MEDKESLRRSIKAQRRAMDPATATSLSNQIIRKIPSAVAWQTVQTVHIYSPIAIYREVDTTLLIAVLARQYPDLGIATWRKTHTGYQAYWLRHRDKKGAVPADHVFDVVIVPLLGFNDAGHRIGYGGGFYDRFLTSQRKSIAIGLCYQMGRVEFAAEPHDIPLQCIITEQGIIRPEGRIGK